jgi:hypothetical protein
LLVVDGKTRISGKCAYDMRGQGGFYITGPRQVFEGIDYRNPQGYGALDQSNDYWAVINREEHGGWSGYGNHDVRVTHGDLPWAGLSRKGACFTGHEYQDQIGTDYGVVRLCLWRK